MVRGERGTGRSGKAIRVPFGSVCAPRSEGWGRAGPCVSPPAWPAKPASNSQTPFGQLLTSSGTRRASWRWRRGSIPTQRRMDGGGRSRGDEDVWPNGECHSGRSVILARWMREGRQTGNQGRCHSRRPRLLLSILILIRSWRNEDQRSGMVSTYARFGIIFIHLTGPLRRKTALAAAPLRG